MMSSGATPPAPPDIAVPGLTKRITPSQAEGAREALRTDLSQTPRPALPQTNGVSIEPAAINSVSGDSRLEVNDTFETDGPTGPPPAFEETPLARQAREALNPNPEVVQEETEVQLEPNVDPPPTPSQRAEAAIAETRALEETSEPTLDQRN